MALLYGNSVAENYIKKQGNLFLFLSIVITTSLLGALLDRGFVCPCVNSNEARDACWERRPGKFCVAKLNVAYSTLYVLVLGLALLLLSILATKIHISKYASKDLN